MSGFKHQYLGVEVLVGDNDQANGAIGYPDNIYVRGLQYSSPLPWIFAAVISLMMWAAIGSLIWMAIR